jgi:hypothetical protein
MGETISSIDVSIFKFVYATHSTNENLIMDFMVQHGVSLQKVSTKRG